jgi:hypothetical protein
MDWMKKAYYIFNSTKSLIKDRETANSPGPQRQSGYPSSLCYFPL